MRRTLPFETITDLKANLCSAIGQSPEAKPIASYSFQDKNIVITGGAGDIGKATAHRFAENGAGIVLLDINEAKMAEVAGELEKYQTPIHTFCCDVTKPDEINRVFADITKQVRLNYVFNNSTYRLSFSCRKYGMV